MALLLAAPVALGVALGLLRGGRLGGLALIRLRAGWLLGLALLVQVLRYQHVPGAERVIGSPDGVTPALLVFALFAAWLAANIAGGESALRVALVLVALGGLANLAVIAANGHMPFSLAQAERAGVPAAEIAVTGDIGVYAPTSPRTRLVWLADVIPTPGVRKVISVGDILILFGTLVAIAQAMVLGRERSPAGGRRPPPLAA
jgi:hypothetical protein